MNKEVLPEVTVILPAFNREMEIGTVVLIAKRYVDRIIVVNNGSSDQCAEVAEVAGAEVIRDAGTSKNLSLKRGIETAEGADILVTMDMDVCRDPRLIPKMIKPISEGNFDLVVGTCIGMRRKSSENAILINNKKTEEKPVGFLVFSKACLKELDLSEIYLNSIRSIMSMCERKKIKAYHIDLQEEHEKTLFKAYRIGVVVPAYNEEILIQETIDGIPEYVDRIYAINDGSSDRTGEIIDRMTDPRIVPIHHKVNKGVGAAIINGYKHALSDEMDLVAVMAGDNQMDPAQLPRLLFPIIEGKADYTKGNRLLSKEMRKGMSTWRAFGNGLLTLITKIGSGYWQITDPQNGYTVISREALEALDLDSVYTYYGYCNDLLIKLNALSFQAVDVSMPARYGRETSTIRYGAYIRKVAPMLFRGFLWRLKMKYIILDFHPLVLFYIASMVLVPTGFLFGIWIVLQKLVLRNPVSTNYPLLNVFISLMGMQLLLFAMFFDMQVNKKTGLNHVDFA
ncbi:glycosyltransferase family 2 protein [Methanosarcina mazei]|uniref:Dolichyl-phosphate beta-D-mannosyltransferase n=1 Tax=Methanosarcina mazei TaxID=2209 RepID=A0A0F8G945_METMZ|nr:glycosyltransferase [Methanosarcina mazei]KKG61852.1 dolichyl-phosphate beta-D-mannosyltransferase [Methanosarcina mazei]KKG81085.1 dolichyl-phosphate beta-D-mannosyltransferase [Methanosarcina mazei]KKG89660.1 dolichyl-phosphate beta-D-mannosyltransferase [Methanosarcina mazei]